MAKMRLSLQCMDCFVCIAEGPLRPATIVYLNTLAGEHVCASADKPSEGALSSEELQKLVDEANGAPTRTL